jgi:hypothetical protein
MSLIDADNDNINLMTSNSCLNCEKELTDQYCSGCGQKADTHRISFSNFFFHDVLHGAFHIEKGILFTAKESLTRPGKAALDYISGKRKRYYNVFYLIVLTIGVMLFFRHIDQLFNNNSGAIVQEKVYLNDASRKMEEIISQKSRLILLLFVPFAAFNSFILFKRRKLNLSEHCILSGMILLGILLLATLANLYFPLNNFLNFSGTIASIVVTAIIIFYVAFGYVNAFKSDYSKLGMAYRIMLFFAMICIEILILFFILFGFASNWKFGEIKVSLFS